MKVGDRQIYRECCGFYKPEGIALPTDAEVIVEMAKRFERDSNEMNEKLDMENVHLLHEIDKLKADNDTLRMKLSALEHNIGVFEEPKRGMTVPFEFNGGIHTLRVTKVTEDTSGTVTLEGKWFR